MKRLFFAAFLLPFALIGCADDATPEEGEGVAVEQPKAAEPELTPQAKPICLPGEKLSCTLGPPPVCSCV
jgi:hypothetical protein